MGPLPFFTIPLMGWDSSLPQMPLAWIGLDEQLHQLMQICLLFCTIKAIFSIIHTHFYKTPVLIYLFYTFIQ